MARLTHQIERRLLITHGIEGVAGQDLQLADAEMLARSFGSFLSRSGARSVAVCFDGTPATPELAAAAMSGLLRSGLDVHRLGAGPLPLLKFAEEKLEMDASLLVSANGLRPERASLRLFQKGVPVSPRMIKAFAEMAAQGDLVHKRGRLIEQPLSADYLTSLLELWRGGATGLTVIWDHRNGSATPVVEGLARRLSGRHLLLQEMRPRPLVIEPNRLGGGALAARLAEALRQEDGDLAFSFDGLGERMIALDRQGQPLSAATVAEAMRLRDGMDMTDPLRLAVLLCASLAQARAAETTKSAATGLSA